jgi:hypothetical protein
MPDTSIQMSVTGNAGSFTHSMNSISAAMQPPKKPSMLKELRAKEPVLLALIPKALVFLTAGIVLWLTLKGQAAQVGGILGASSGGLTALYALILRSGVWSPRSVEELKAGVATAKDTFDTLTRVMNSLQALHMKMPKGLPELLQQVQETLDEVSKAGDEPDPGSAALPLDPPAELAPVVLHDDPVATPPPYRPSENDPSTPVQVPAYMPAGTP